MLLNDRLLSELHLDSGEFRALMSLPGPRLGPQLYRLQHQVRIGWRQRAFELHPDRNPGHEELFVELGEYVAELLALTPEDIPQNVNVAVETEHGRLQVVFHI